MKRTTLEIEIGDQGLADLSLSLLPWLRRQQPLIHPQGTFRVPPCRDEPEWELRRSFCVGKEK